MNIYENDKFYVVRKPNGIATTFGDQLNFMEIIDRQKEESQIISNLYNKFTDVYIDRENEFGLLNRLDNGTGGCLRFAKSLEIYDEHRNKQKDNLIKKTYIANVYGKFNDETFSINTPIWHHYSDKARMSTDPDMARKTINCQTDVRVVYYNEVDDISQIQIDIRHGVRHQIRVHLASIGKYIAWEDLYTTKGFRKILSENKLRMEDNLAKYIYTESNWSDALSNDSTLAETNNIYLDNYLYNRDILTYHLWSIWFVSDN